MMCGIDERRWRTSCRCYTIQVRTNKARIIIQASNTHATQGCRLSTMEEQSKRFGLDIHGDMEVNKTRDGSTIRKHTRRKTIDGRWGRLELPYIFGFCFEKGRRDTCFKGGRGRGVRTYGPKQTRQWEGAGGSGKFFFETECMYGGMLAEMYVRTGGIYVGSMRKCFWFGIEKNFFFENGAVKRHRRVEPPLRTFSM